MLLLLLGTHAAEAGGRTPPPDARLVVTVRNVQQRALGRVPRPATPAYGTISQAFRGAIDSSVRGADAHAELSKAATRIDRQIAAHRGYPYP